MSGSQHNPNGRQSQLGSTWNPAMQMQMANLLARSQQLTPAHLNDRGVTWHTPTPPPHMYLPAPSPPDPLQGLQAMKSAGGNSVYRHTATPPDMYRHTPTPPEKHMMRGTPSPGDPKGPPLDIYQHMGPGRETRLRPDDILSFARQGSLDLSLGSRNGGTPPAHPAHPTHPTHPAHPAHSASPALSVRDAPTINSLIARAAPRRVDSLLERLVPSPHSVIVHSRAANTPSPPSSNEDSADSCGAPPGSKRKRKPERTVRLPTAPLPPPPVPSPSAALSLHGPHPRGGAVENGDAEHATSNGPEKPRSPVQENRSILPTSAPKSPVGSKSPRSLSPATIAQPPVAGDRSLYAAVKSPVASSKSPVAGDRLPVAGDHLPKPESPRTVEERSRRKTRSGSAETIADIAAMIAGGGTGPPPPAPPATPALSVDKLQSVLGSPETAAEPDATHEPHNTTASTPASAPRRRSSRPLSTSPRRIAPSPSEAVPAEPPPSTGGLPVPAIPDLSMAEVENQLEIMFAGLEEPQGTEATETAKDPKPAPATKRRKSSAGRVRTEPQPRRRGPRKKPEAKVRKPKEVAKETKEYDSGSNASSGKSRGPYIQIRGGSVGSPVSVCVMNATTGDEEEWTRRREARPDTRRRGLHASTLGLRYDAATRDLTWLCAFCARPPHASGLGDLFGPYPVDTDIHEYRVLEEASRRRATCVAGANGRLEAWLHAACGVWAPGVLACGARVHGLAQAVWSAASVPCGHCTRGGAPLACSGRACAARAHLPCAREHGWRLDEDDFRALCPSHAPHPVPE